MLCSHNHWLLARNDDPIDINDGTIVDYPGDVVDDILEKTRAAHERTYYESDPQSPEAVQCRKRDDMSLVVHVPV